MCRPRFLLNSCRIVMYNFTKILAKFPLNFSGRVSQKNQTKKTASGFMEKAISNYKK